MSQHAAERWAGEWAAQVDAEWLQTWGASVTTAGLWSWMGGTLRLRCSTGPDREWWLAMGNLVAVEKGLSPWPDGPPVRLPEVGVCEYIWSQPLAPVNWRPPFPRGADV